MRHHTHRDGFSILETIVAIGIISMALIAILPISNSSFGANRSSSSEVTAVYLAQDAFEFMRNIRDAIQLDLGQPFKDVLAPCMGARCILKTSEPSSTIYETVAPCDSACPPLRFNDEAQSYGYQSAWRETQFSRAISATQISDFETLVTVTIDWKEGDGGHSLVLQRLYYDFSQIIYDAKNPVVLEEIEEDAPPPPNPVPANNLVSWWEFDESGGSTAFDGWSSNNGSIIGNPPRGPGVKGSALVMDGTEDYVSLGSPAVFDDLAAFSFAAWIYPPSLSGGALEGIFAKGTAGAFSTGNQRWAVIDNSAACGGTGCLEITVNRSGTDAIAISIPGTVKTNRWQMVVFAFDATHGPRLYWNSAPVAYRVGPTTGSGAPESDAADSLLLGTTGGSGGFFRGSIDEARVYTRALSPTEVSDLYNATKP